MYNYYRPSRQIEPPNLTKKAQVHLPGDYPWKVLTWMVQDLGELLSSDEVALLSQVIRDRDMYALQLLDDIWGLQSIDSQSDRTLCKIRARYQVASLLRKFRFPTERQARVNSAIKKFKDAEKACSDYNRVGYRQLVSGETEFDACVFTYARSYLRKVLGVNAPNKEIVTRWSRHGPGSNLDTEQGRISLYTKFKKFPYSVTQDALPYARFLIATDQRWIGALHQEYRRRNNIPMNFPIDVKEFWSSVFKVVKGNRIAFAPKNALTERSIAIEPTMNLMLQLGVNGHIRTRLKRWNVDLDSQLKNQFMAFSGSTNQCDDSYVTLDLKAASDTISLAACRALLPVEWYSYLCKLRSPSGVLDDDVILYEKMSSMGNGFTFALESAIFAAIVYGTIKATNGSVDTKTDFSIFGDDLIVRRKIAATVVEQLERTGFSLNLDKSFLKGNVRESCGSDWFKGSALRPVFLKQLPTDVMGLFTDINRLKRILSLRWGIEESLTVKNMQKWVPERFRGFTGPCSDQSFDSYLHQSKPKWRGPKSQTFNSFSDGVYEYARLIKLPAHEFCKDFFFRKLMHDLRGRTEIEKFNFATEFQKISSAGSRFAIIKSYSLMVSKTYSQSEIWTEGYAEDITPDVRWIDHTVAMLRPEIIQTITNRLIING